MCTNEALPIRHHRLALKLISNNYPYESYGAS